MLIWIIRAALATTGTAAMWWESSHHSGMGIGFGLAMAMFIAAGAIGGKR